MWGSKDAITYMGCLLAAARLTRSIPSDYFPIRTSLTKLPVKVCTVYSIKSFQEAQTNGANPSVQQLMFCAE